VRFDRDPEAISIDPNTERRSWACTMVSEK
jgi:hypothetical protein